MLSLGVLKAFKYRSLGVVGILGRSLGWRCNLGAVII